MAMQNRRGEGRAASAGELAWRLERLVECGIAFLQQGWCIGAPRAEEIVVTADGVLSTGRRPASMLRQRAHLRRGHDDGCRALGVPRETLSALLRAWDGIGAARLLEEACDEAIAEIRASPVGWQPDRARDALAYAVRLRITPRAPDL